MWYPTALANSAPDETVIILEMDFTKVQYKAARAAKSDLEKNKVKIKNNIGQRHLERKDNFFASGSSHWRNVL